jgi:prophage antirepressor-like protein
MLQLFRFESKEVRCYGTWDKPIWIAQEICDCLELQGDAGQHVRRLDDDEKALISIQTLGGIQDVLGVNEPGLYALALGCRKPIAKRFKRWLTHEVLPSIRKTGSYSINQQPTQQSSVKEEIDILKDCLSIAGLDPRLIAGVALNHAGTRMPGLKGAVQEGHELLAASGQAELLLTPTKIGKELGISSRKVNEILLGMGFQVKNAGKTSKTEPDYLVTEAGRPYAGNTMATGKLQDNGADNSTYQHLKWKDSVIAEIQNHLRKVV